MSINTFNTLRTFENQLFRNFPVMNPTSHEGYKPQVNSLEEEKAYLLDVDLPGVSKETIKIDVKDRELTITGERLMKDEHQKEDYFLLEIKYGKLSRVFTLPENADAENITASHDNGVLSLSIPKIEEVDNHYSIPIK